MSRAKVLTNARFRGAALPIKSRWIVVLGSLVLFLVMNCSCVPNNNSSGQETLSRSKGQDLSQGKKIPVIFDTDIGSDIDDTWALALLLQSPELDIKLITTVTGDTLSRAKIVAKILEITGRTDIPVGIGAPVLGVPIRSQRCYQKSWVKDYKLSSYPGTIYQDGVKALVDTIMNSPEPITVISVGPLPNIAAALEREPRIAEKAEFIGMQGSIRIGYDGRPRADREYNVVQFVKEAQKVFTSAWNMTITPLDTCGIVKLKGEKYQKVLKRNSPLTRAIIEGYREWLKNTKKLKKLDKDKINTSSTILCDTVAVYLAMSTELVQMEKLGIRVTDRGYTIIDNKAKVINCATKWKDLNAFEDFLVDRLTK